MQIEGGVGGTPGMEPPENGQRRGTFESLGKEMVIADPQRSIGGSGNPEWTVSRTETTTAEVGT